MIVGAMLVRNEAAPDRYLRRVCEQLSRYCDKLVFVDDGSTDATASICAEFGEVTSRTSDGFWGTDETLPRSLLWELAVDVAGDDGWVLICDADQELTGITPDELRRLTESDGTVAWAWVLYDAWNSEIDHRVDKMWRAWENPRSWLFKAHPYPGFAPDWVDGGIHVGHAPINFPNLVGIVPPPAGWLHLSYVSADHRKRKAESYLSLC
jgi:hypothetical protein